MRNRENRNAGKQNKDKQKTEKTKFENKNKAKTKTKKQKQSKKKNKQTKNKEKQPSKQTVIKQSKTQKQINQYLYLSIKFEDTQWIIRSHNSKDSQYNGQRKRTK
jgi:outer membrane biosynthesis protein TonB